MAASKVVAIFGELMVIVVETMMMLMIVIMMMTMVITIMALTMTLRDNPHMKVGLVRPASLE